MSSFDETQHPRAATGKWTDKVNDAPSGELTHGDAEIGPLKVSILPEPDPRGGFDTQVDAPSGRHFLRGSVPHREDGPAYEGRDGSEAWYQNGQLHRDPQDGPAVIDEYENEPIEEFYEHGQLVVP